MQDESRHLAPVAAFCQHVNPWHNLCRHNLARDLRAQHLTKRRRAIMLRSGGVVHFSGGYTRPLTVGCIRTWRGKGESRRIRRLKDNRSTDRRDKDDPGV